MQRRFGDDKNPVAEWRSGESSTQYRVPRNGFGIGFSRPCHGYRLDGDILGMHVSTKRLKNKQANAKWKMQSAKDKRGPCGRSPDLRFAEVSGCAWIRSRFQNTSHEE